MTWACMLQIARFKETELAQLRVLEREHCRQEIDKARREVCLFEADFNCTRAVFTALVSRCSAFKMNVVYFTAISKRDRNNSWSTYLVIYLSSLLETIN